MVTIVTDSTSCIQKNEAVLWGITVIPLTYVIDGVGYEDGFSDLPPRLPVAYSMPPAANVYYKTFSGLLNAGYDVLCICTSSKFSGSYRNASTAARALQTDRVRIVDSNTTGGGLYFLVREAAALAKQGLPLKKIGDTVSVRQRGISVHFSVDDLRFLAIGKRLHAIRQSNRAILNQRPILTFEQGAIVHEGVASRGIGEIKALTDRLNRPGKIIVHYARPHPIIGDMVGHLKKRFPRAKIYIRRITNVLQINIGSNILGIVAI